MNKRKAVIPGEVIKEDENSLPGEWTEKKGNKIIALRYGLAEEVGRLIKVIPLSGPYQPRKGNIVIGQVELITFNGWIIDIRTFENAFLPLSEIPRYINKESMEDILDIGDTVIAKVRNVGKRGVELSLKSRGLGRVEEGIIFKINSNKVPRVIGKEGSMINLIKKNTECDIIVGQNGFIWVKGDSIEKELLAKKAIMFVAEKSHITGLTEEIIKWFEKEENEK